MQTVLQDYHPGTSLWHQMDPRWKLVALFMCSTSTALLPQAFPVTVALGLTLLLLATAGLPWSWWRGRLGSMGGFLLLVLVLFPLTVPGEGWSWGWLHFSLNGLALGLMVAGKTMTILSLALLLLATSRQATLAHAAHWLGLPALLVRLLLLIYRYLHLLYEELGKLRVALRLRGYRNRLSGHGLQTIGHVTGSLLVRSHERAERVAQAMRCRGYPAPFRQLTQFHTGVMEVLLFSNMVLLIIGCPWLIWLLWRQNSW